MSERSEYFLSTGEFAKICETTKDTLRHYHEIGVLVPHRNEANGYFYYSIDQVTAYYFINISRQLDTPLKTIKTHLASSDENNYYNICRAQLNSLVKMRSEIDNKIIALSNATMLMRHMKRYPQGEPHIFRFREKTTYYTTPITSLNSLHASDIIPDIRRHLSTCKKRSEIISFPISVTIDRDDFFHSRYVYKTLCSCIQAKVNGRDIFQMPSKTVVGCSCMNGPTNIQKHYETLKQYIKEHKITVISDLFSINLFNFVDEQEEHRYLKYIFFCIQE